TGVDRAGGDVTDVRRDEDPAVTDATGAAEAAAASGSVGDAFARGKPAAAVPACLAGAPAGADGSPEDGSGLVHEIAGDLSWLLSCDAWRDARATGRPTEEEVPTAGAA
ncbi:MAG: hypothetical protein L6Q95_14915, partial [Planctomycetes bacterium]|nr:hypothetical protein [Planctomycetota bacterium]